MHTGVARLHRRVAACRHHQEVLIVRVLHLSVVLLVEVADGLVVLTLGVRVVRLQKRALDVSK